MSRSPSRAWVPACLLAVAGGCGAAPIEAVTVSSETLTRGLVAHWAFDEESGTTISDGSGNGRDGQLTGGAWAQPGRFGRGLRMQPGDSAIIPGFPQATRDWTVSVWINLSAEDRAAFTADRAVLLTAEKPAMGGWEVEFDPRPGFDWLEASYYAAPPTNDYIVLDCKCIDVDRWLHFTAVFDGTNQRFSLYRGGTVVDGADMPAPILPGESDLYIGRWIRGERFIGGVIDDFAVWSRALSRDEVAAIDARVVPDPS